MGVFAQRKGLEIVTSHDLVTMLLVQSQLPKVTISSLLRLELLIKPSYVKIIPQKANMCSKSTIKTLEKV